MNYFSVNPLKDHCTTKPNEKLAIKAFQPSGACCNFSFVVNYNEKQVNLQMREGRQVSSEIYIVSIIMVNLYKCVANVALNLTKPAKLFKCSHVRLIIFIMSHSL